MASEAQIAANRLNAQKSTGPRTPRGKAAMRRNPLRHPPSELGSTARPTALRGDPARIVTLGKQSRFIE